MNYLGLIKIIDVNYLLVFLGGGVGSVLRYGVSQLSLPLPTMWVNVLGSFLIGVFYSLSARWGWSPEVRLLVTTGLCGGFTTFSTFCNEGLTMLRAGQVFQAALYVSASVLLGILAAWLGYLLTR